MSPSAHHVREFVSADPVSALTADLLEFAATPGEKHFGLTGGRSGAAITQALAQHVANRPDAHLWFSDERHLPLGDPQRNDVNLVSAGRAVIHRVPYVQGDVHEAARRYAAELHLHTTSRFCSDNTMMDITVLSIGPDGHVASLFPHHEALRSTAAVTAIQDSPKPPPVRVTWTYPTINASRQVWLLATGTDKAQAVAAMRAHADLAGIPAAGVAGKHETRLYTDVLPSLH